MSKLCSVINVLAVAKHVKNILIHAHPAMKQNGYWITIAYQIALVMEGMLMMVEFATNVSIPVIPVLVPLHLAQPAYKDLSYIITFAMKIARSVHLPDLVHA